MSDFKGFHAHGRQVYGNSGEELVSALVPTLIMNLCKTKMHMSRILLLRYV